VVSPTLVLRMWCRQAQSHVAGWMGNAVAAAALARVLCCLMAAVLSHGCCARLGTRVARSRTKEGGSLLWTQRAGLGTRRPRRRRIASQHASPRSTTRAVAGRARLRANAAGPCKPQLPPRCSAPWERARGPCGGAQGIYSRLPVPCDAASAGPAQAPLAHAPPPLAPRIGVLAPPRD